MDVEKLRNLTDAELQHQQQELNDQLFRLKFQLKMGQTESLNKIRGLRKDVARVHTVVREKQLGIVVESHPAAAGAGEGSAGKAKPAKKKTAGNGSKKKHGDQDQGSRKTGQEKDDRYRQEEEEVNGRDNRKKTRQTQYQDRPRDLHQDEQDDCGAGDHEESSPALSPRGGQGEEVLCAR